MKDEIAARVGTYVAGLPQQQQQQAGAAFAGLDVEVPEPSATDTVLAYQAGAGFGYALTDTVTLQFGYRLQAVNGLQFTGGNDSASTRAETDLLIHFLEIGVRHRF